MHAPPVGEIDSTVSICHLFAAGVLAESACFPCRVQTKRPESRLQIFASQLAALSFQTDSARGLQGLRLALLGAWLHLLGHFASFVLFRAEHLPEIGCAGFSP